MRTSLLCPRALIRAAVLFVGCGSLAGFAGNAQALVITPVFDTTITSLSDAAAVEGAIDQAIGVFDRDFSSNVDIKIGFSWGKIDGQSVSSADVSESVSYLYTGFSYADVVSDLKSGATANPTDTVLTSAAAHLPASNPTGMSSFSITEADAQALGLTPPTGMERMAMSGSIRPTPSPSIPRARPLDSMTL